MQLKSKPDKLTGFAFAVKAELGFAMARTRLLTKPPVSTHPEKMRLSMFVAAPRPKTVHFATERTKRFRSCSMGSADLMELQVSLLFHRVLMKSILVTVMAILASLFINSVYAQSGQCGFIKDPNLQAQCRAGTGGGGGQCGFIRDSDMQAYCRATTGGGSGQCGFIRDNDHQAMCRAVTGSGSGQCGFIRNNDLQAYCRAMTGSGSGQCGFIRDNDLQAMCRATTGGGIGQCGFIRDNDMQALCRAKKG